MVGRPSQAVVEQMTKLKQTTLERKGMANMSIHSIFVLTLAGN
jgi:hypothetical protein